ncbi:MAG: hypothetical protein ACJAYU_004764 [Bradymonadia bacterium]
MKLRRLDFHPDFSDDLASAAECFLENVPERVEDFLADYDKKLDDVLRDPELYAIREEDGLRRANLDTFAYSIRYDWEHEILPVVTFAHHHQDTVRWMRRLAEMRRNRS